MPKSFRRAVLSTVLSTIVFTNCGGGGNDKLLVDCLTSALSGRRWVEPRLTGVTTYQTCRLECRDGRLLCEAVCDPPESAVPHNLVQKVSPCLEDLNDGARKQVRAIWTLLSSRELEEAERAVNTLRQLAEQNPSEPRIWNDLAAAWLVLAERADRPSQLAHALEAAEKSVGLRETPEARFNQALALGKLFLESAARTTWNRYLQLDGGSGWAAEARRRTAELDAAVPTVKWREARDRLHLGRAHPNDAVSLVRAFPRAARTWVEEEILPAWAEAEARDARDEAGHHLNLAKALTGELTRTGGDLLLRDTLAAIEDARGRGAVKRRLDLLIKGHRAYGRAARHYHRYDVRQAAEAYQEARWALGEAGSPFAEWSRVGLASVQYLLGNYREAHELLSRLPGSAAGHGYRALAAHAAWIEAACRLALAQPLEALELYRRALELYRSVGERENEVNLHARLADALEAMGERRLAWRHRYEALRDVHRLRKPRDRSFVFSDAALAATNLELPLSATHFLDEAVRQAERAGSHPHLTISLLHQANAYRLAGKLEQARNKLARARQTRDRLTDPGVRESLGAQIHKMEGLVWLQASRPKNAIRSLEAALDLLLQTDEHGYLAGIYSLLARAARDDGQSEKAENALNAAVHHIEDEWEAVLSSRQVGKNENLWLSYFDQPRETFDSLIELLAEQGRSAEAFSVCERAHARELLALIAQQGSGGAAEEGRFLRWARPLAASQIRELTFGKTLIAYWLLGKRLLIWVFHDGELDFQQVWKPRDEIEVLVREIQEYAEGRLSEAEVLSVLEELHGVLIPEAVLHLGEKHELVFVSDGMIHGVPFGALRDPRTGRHLIQDHPISLAPSATLHVYAAERSRALGAAPPASALLIGDPALDLSLFPDLPRLTGAIAEVEQVARFYPASTLLNDDKATAPELSRAAKKHEVLHFAGHAVVHHDNPALSFLALAPSGSDSGVLYAHDLLRLEYPRTRLVVLSACSTAGGHPVGAIGVSSLIRPFLAAGAPAVVGSLWNVGDELSKELMIRFHRRFSRGEDAATALRGAQLELIGHRNRALRSVFAWAPFQVIGAASLKER